MSEDFSLTLAFGDEIDNLEDIKNEIINIPEIYEVDEVKHHSLGLCLIIVLLAPLLTEIIVRKSPKAYDEFKEIITEILRRGKRFKAKLVIKYKRLKMSIKNEKEIDPSLARLKKFLG